MSGLQMNHMEKPEVVHDDVQSDASSIKDDVAKVILQDAKDASKDEHETTFREALKLHKKAVFWAVVMSLTIVMEVCILSGSFSYLCKLAGGTNINPLQSTNTETSRREPDGLTNFLGL